MTESRRRRFVSVSRVLSQHNDTVIDAICEEGRAWWLVIGPGIDRTTIDNPPYTWSELRPLPEIEVEVAEPTRPTPAPAPTPEAAPVATDEELCKVYNDAPGRDFGPAIRAVYNLGRQHGATQLLGLEKELERERLRLAACGVVAMADTPESAARARDIDPSFQSASLDDVARQVDALMEARAAQPAHADRLALALCAANSDIGPCSNACEDCRFLTAAVTQELAAILRERHGSSSVAD